jgi:uncharacterized caspase-like protein
LAVLVAHTVLAQAETRSALVIGNNLYDPTAKPDERPNLINPVNDARLIARQLEANGFRVHRVENAGVDAFYEAIEHFKKLSADADLGLIYYAGHGMEVDGQNYLIPVGAVLETQAQLKTQAISLKTLLEEMALAGIGAKMVVLDCCRDNPLSATRAWLRKRSRSSKGLAEISDQDLQKLGGATMIMFSAGPGQQAADGSGANSPFTEIFARVIASPDLNCMDAFLKVSDHVKETTGEQEPWIKFDGAGRAFREFSFVSTGRLATKTSVSAPDSPPAQSTLTQKLQQAKNEWLNGNTQRAIEVYQQILVVEPNNQDAALALQRIRDHQQKPANPGVSDGPFESSLGVRFLPAGTSGVLFAEWEIRVADFRRFVEETQYDCEGNVQSLQGGSWAPGTHSWKNPGFPQTADHPVVGISWKDAQAFCKWLTDCDQRSGLLQSGWRYRLPTDEEWSTAAGLTRENGSSPKEKDLGSRSEFPWGNTWPPPARMGNLADRTPGTVSVGKSEANAHGLRDLFGNVWEWCEDSFEPRRKWKVLRGGSWNWGSGDTREYTLGFRHFDDPSARWTTYGLRPVLDQRGSGN